jgi:nucleotide-binding universal stress UspA family protein
MRPQLRIVVGVDFSAESLSALGRAALLAEQCGGTLRLLHVIPREDIDAFAEESLLHPGVEERVLAAARARLSATLGAFPMRARDAAEIEVAVGRVHEQCLRAAEAADLLVLGPRGDKLLRNLFIGSTADRLLRASPCPVLVVEQAPAGPYSNVLLPLDDPERAGDALDAAARWAPEATMLAVHAIRVPLESSMRLAGADDDAIARVRSRARQEAARRFAELQPPLARPGRWHLSVIEGDPLPVILDQAATARADLIVIGKQGRAPWQEFLLGSVTRRVLAAAPCDVLVLPSPHGPT